MRSLLTALLCLRLSSLRRKTLVPFQYCANLLQMIQIDAVGVERAIIGGLGLGANQGVGSTAAFRDVGQVESISVDDLVQVFPPLFGQGEPERSRTGIIEKADDLSAVLALARNL